MPTPAFSNSSCLYSFILWAADLGGANVMLLKIFSIKKLRFRLKLTKTVQVNAKNYHQIAFLDNRIFRLKSSKYSSSIQIFIAIAWRQNPMFFHSFWFNVCIKILNFQVVYYGELNFMYICKFRTCLQVQTLKSIEEPASAMHWGRSLI
jgi:hypothetical protein